TSNSWRVMPQDFPADSVMVTNLLAGLTGMEILQFVKDVVTEPDLPAYGLASPSRQYILRTATNNAATPTNCLIAEVHFGTNQEDKVFVRRTDESFVYAVKRSDVEHLPAASWHLRERQIWNFSESDIA